MEREPSTKSEKPNGDKKEKPLEKKKEAWPVCPKCGKPKEFFLDSGTFYCTECDEEESLKKKSP